ncbi:MAG: hypothetical protein WB795_07100 [Candidatus Acidiferrales bacterium]
MIPAETAPLGFAATAIGLATLFGEIFGGALSPAVAGAVADRFGLAAPLWIASGGAIVVFLAACGMIESSPHKEELEAGLAGAGGSHEKELRTVDGARRDTYNQEQVDTPPPDVWRTYFRRVRSGRPFLSALAQRRRYARLGRVGHT